MSGELQARGKLLQVRSDVGWNQMRSSRCCHGKEMATLTISLAATTHARVHGRYHRHCTMATLPKEVLRREVVETLDQLYVPKGQTIILRISKVCNQTPEPSVDWHDPINAGISSLLRISHCGMPSSITTGKMRRRIGGSGERVL